MPSHSTKSITRSKPVPSAVIPDIDLVSTVPPKSISVKTVKSMDISQVLQPYYQEVKTSLHVVDAQEVDHL